VSREPDALSGTCDNEDLRIAVGALALGALDQDEAREVRRHLADCPECQEEYASFVGVKRVMDIGLVGAPMPEVMAPEGPPRRSWKRSWFGAPTPAPFRAPRRRRVLTGATGFAAACALIIGGFWAGHSGRRGTPTAGWEALPPASQAGVTAQISYQQHAWGTSVSTEVSGTPAGLHCTLYVVDKNQAMVPLSNWRSVAGKAIDIPAATSLPATQIDHFEVRVVGYGGYDITVPMTS
jgi:hypothetical protein